MICSNKSLVVVHVIASCHVGPFQHVYHHDDQDKRGDMKRGGLDARDSGDVDLLDAVSRCVQWSELSTADVGLGSNDVRTSTR
jgi:hypothetical protein